MNHLQVTSNAMEKIAEHLKGGKALDVGCRDQCMRGTIEKYGYKWEGCDLYGGMSIIQCKMEDMYPIKSEEYDLVFCCHAFEHCERPVEALFEMQRVLKPNGILFLSTPVHCEHQILLADEDHINVATPMQMQRFLMYTDFEKVDLFIERNNVEEDKAHSMITIARKKVNPNE